MVKFKVWYSIPWASGGNPPFHNCEDWNGFLSLVSTGYSLLRPDDFGNISISFFPDLQETFIRFARLSWLSLPLVSLTQMIMNQRIVGIEFEDAFILRDCFIL